MATAAVTLPASRSASSRHVLVGAGAAVLLVLLYLGVNTLTQGVGHALDQAGRQWYWIAALAAGFGVQAGLFSHVRHSSRALRASTTTSVAASGGVSGGSMVACCAHHLADVVPALGLAGVAAVLADYQTTFMLVGVLSNVLGVTIMLEAIQCQQLPGARWLARWDMARAKKRTAFAAAGVLAAWVLVQVLA